MILRYKRRLLVFGVDILTGSQVHRLGESASFQQYESKLNPRPYLGCEKYAFGSDDYWKCCIKGYTSSLQHQVS